MDEGGERASEEVEAVAAHERRTHLQIHTAVEALIPENFSIFPINFRNQARLWYKGAEIAFSGVKSCGKKVAVHERRTHLRVHTAIATSIA